MKTSFGNVFIEFAIERCNEILSSDADYNKFNMQIINLENDFLSKLTPELSQIYLKIDSLKEQQQVNNYIKLYIAGLKDKKNMPI